MKNTKVINLGSVRDLLAEWERVRHAILAGQITGFQTTLMGPQQQETIYLGGVYREDPKRALSAILKTSAARVLVEDSPPPVLRSVQP